MKIALFLTRRQGIDSLISATGRTRRWAARAARPFLLLALWAWPAALQAQFECATNNGTITITGYSGSGGEVEIPEALHGLPVVGLGKAAFQNGGELTDIRIPASVTDIGDNAFGGCAHLRTITVDGFNPYFSSTPDGVLLDRLETELIQCPGGVTGSYAVPLSVTKIGDYAFYKCAGLTRVMIPNSTLTIGDYAFYGCVSLKRCHPGRRREPDRHRRVLWLCQPGGTGDPQQRRHHRARGVSRLCEPGPRLDSQ